MRYPAPQGAPTFPQGTLHNRGRSAMNFWIFLVGFVIVIGGVAWAMSLAHVSTTWIMVSCVILLGLGILTAVTRTRQKDPPG